MLEEQQGEGDHLGKDALADLLVDTLVVIGLSALLGTVFHLLGEVDAGGGKAGLAVVAKDLVKVVNGTLLKLELAEVAGGDDTGGDGVDGNLTADNALGTDILRREHCHEQYEKYASYHHFCCFIWFIFCFCSISGQSL